MSNVESQELERTNYGLNKRILNNNYPMNYEIDVIMRALNVFPDDPELPLTQYKNPLIFTNLSV